MPRYVALLRAVNVGGRVMKMAQLKTVIESLGFTNVETFIASGNVVFSTKSTAVPAMVRRIETALAAAFNYEVPVFIRTDSEIATLASRKYEVFSKAEVDAGHSLSIGVLHAPLSEQAKAALNKFNTDTEEFRVHDREIYMLLRVPTVDSKFSITKLEKGIGASTTFRNVNTMERLAKKYPGL